MGKIILDIANSFLTSFTMGVRSVSIGKSPYWGHMHKRLAPFPSSNKKHIFREKKGSKIFLTIQTRAKIYLGEKNLRNDIFEPKPNEGVFLLHFNSFESIFYPFPHIYIVSLITITYIFCSPLWDWESLYVRITYSLNACSCKSDDRIIFFVNTRIKLQYS